MRALLASALVLAGCSGLPPDTLVPLQGGETAGGVALAVDLGGAPNPDVSLWAGFGLGRGVDLAVGGDLPMGFAIGGPRAVLLPRAGLLPGLAVRKTFENGVGVGVGTGSRLLLIPSDSTANVPHVATAGAFVTTATAADQTAQGRVTLHIGYAEVLRPNARMTRGVALHVAGQGGAAIALAETAPAVMAVRASAGAFVWPALAPVQGPTLGLTVQGVDRE